MQKQPSYKKMVRPLKAGVKKVLKSKVATKKNHKNFNVYNQRWWLRNDHKNVEPSCKKEVRSMQKQPSCKNWCGS